MPYNSNIRFFKQYFFLINSIENPPRNPVQRICLIRYFIIITSFIFFENDKKAYFLIKRDLKNQSDFFSISNKELKKKVITVYKSGKQNRRKKKALS